MLLIARFAVDDRFEYPTGVFLSNAQSDLTPNLSTQNLNGFMIDSDYLEMQNCPSVQLWK